ncbi:MAG: chorismate synthase [Clostridia bacterium]|nr:chorismate synthase [Clostridia bacterium]
MNGNTFGKLFRVTTTGESYSGCFRKTPDIPKELYGGLITVVDGCPAGIKITAEDIQKELDKRKPGQSKLDSPRKEKDKVYVFSGVMENQLSTGAPIGILVPNNDIEDIHVGQYHDYATQARPGHAEYTFMKKYGQYADWVGAGRASGRETVGRVAGGAVAKAILDKYGIDVIAYTVESHGIKAKPIDYETAKANYRKNNINCPDLEAAKLMEEDILKVRETGETCGGVVELIVRGVPAGLGEPVFDKLEAVIAHGIMSIGAVKGVEFGAGFGVANMVGSECNDEMYWDKETGRVKFYSNNAGGFLGGISNGDEIRVRMAVKPTPTVDVVQRTIDVREGGKDVELAPITRRDASLLPRIYPVAEAMVRIAIVDAMMQFKGYRAMEDLDEIYDRM